MDEVVFDRGPQPPVRPVKPQVMLDAVDLPPGAEGDPALEPASRSYAAAYAQYLVASDAYPAERAAWEKQHGKGPVQISVNSAAEVIERDPARFSLTMPAEPLPEGDAA
jgi:hypothetical protein